jgi:hypothetical protein
MHNFLHFLKYIFGAASPLSETTPDERACLQKHASGRRRLVEIGVRHGVNTRGMREVMAHDGVLVAIDPYRLLPFRLGVFGWAKIIAHREAGKACKGRVLWIEDLGKSAVNYPSVQPLLPVDFLFIEGDHSWEGIAGDWEAWSGNVAPGGIVALHDSRNKPDWDSQRFTDEVARKDSRYRFIEGVDTLTVLQRCG